MKCEFCNNFYSPIPQVKNPRACKNPKCQEKRQRANVKEWREKHRGLYDGKYHRIQRQKRFNKLKELAKKICECIKVGKEFLNQRFNLDVFKEYFHGFLLELGIRNANKLWSDAKLLNNEGIMEVVKV